MNELDSKLAIARRAMSNAKADSGVVTAVRLRGVDWFAWATCGGSNVVLLAAETGVAEVLITQDGAWVLTDEIESARLAAEEVPQGLPVLDHPWADRGARDAIVRERAGGGVVASDRPGEGEVPLPNELVRARWSLLAEEQERYRVLGADAARAMTEVLRAARPEWTEFELAGAGAEALWARGIHPALTLVGGERRLPIYRHATASREPLGARAMLVFCGRRQGLFANLTRFVYFREPSAEERRLVTDAAKAEAAALNASLPGATLGQVLRAITAAYAAAGHEGAERFHHQGGSCGYLSRDVIATPDSSVELERSNAIAWNPSLPGAKIEDTALVHETGVEILTVDPDWPVFEIGGRKRPDILVR